MYNYTTSRIDYLDIAKGIGIILVYIGHCSIGECSETFEDVVYWIYSFHMPFFFFVSGLLFSHKQVNAKEFLWRKSVSLLIPYVIFSVINWPLLKLFVHSPGNVLLGGWGRNPLWFIPVLFLIEVLHYFILEGRVWQKTMSVTTLLIVLVWKTHYNQWLPYCVSELTWFYFCFLTGFVVKPYISKLVNEKQRIVVPFTLIAIHIAVLFFIIKPYNANYRLQDDDLLSYIMRYGMGMLGTLALLSLSTKITRYSHWLKWIGQNTMVILCTHKLYYEILQTQNYQPELMGGTNHFFVIVLTIFSIWLYNKYVTPQIITLKNIHL